MKKRMSVMALALATIMLLTACAVHPTEKASAEDVPMQAAVADTSEMDFDFSKRELSGEYDEDDATVILGTGGEASITGDGAEIASSGLTITGDGTFILRGTFTDLPITVASDEEKVQIVLDGAEIANSKGPGLFIQSADNAYITLAAGSVNSISDGSSYSAMDGTTNLDAALFSRADLAINGTGTLNVSGNYKHGIVSKDDLVIASCTLNVTANSVGLNGKDCVKMSGGTFSVTAGTDGIRSDNDEDASRGYVYIVGSAVNIAAGNDGIQAETVLKTENAQLNILSGGGSGQALWNSEESYKGMKAGSDIQISGGAYVIDSTDDSVHSNNTITISGGAFTLSSGDDGIHADTDISISGGSINILKSYEGIEGTRVLISGGEISIVAADDGLNAAGGNDGSGTGNRFGRGHFSNSTGAIEIAGGYVVIDAMGDGIDSNGTIAVRGGVTLVSGPVDRGNSAFDYDGSATVSGGVLIAAGSAAMMQGFTEAENQGALVYGFGAQEAGTSIALCGADGTAVVSFVPAKAFESVVITAPGIVQGGSYTLVAGGTVDGADEHGFAQNGVVSGGKALGTIDMSSLLYGSGRSKRF